MGCLVTPALLFENLVRWKDAGSTLYRNYRQQIRSIFQGGRRGHSPKAAADSLAVTQQIIAGKLIAAGGSDSSLSSLPASRSDNFAESLRSAIVNVDHVQQAGSTANKASQFCGRLVRIGRASY